MTEVVLFHHILGVTPGVTAFAARLRSEGHTVHVPDLFGGRTFETIEAGQEYAETVPWQSWGERAAEAVADVRGDVVYAGFSFGCGPVHKLAQSKPGARGALFFHGFVAPQWMGPLPDPIPVQIHAMANDPYFVEDGGVEGAEAVLAGRRSAELFLYGGSAHLFTDSSQPSYDADATEALTGRVLAFLNSL